MSAAAMQSGGQYAQIPTSSGSYVPQSGGRQYMQNDEAYYVNQAGDAANVSQPSRHQRRNNGSSNNSPAPQQVYYSAQTSGQSRHDSPRSHQSIPQTSDYPPSSMTTIPIHTRNRSAVPDQYDGAPTIPTRGSSQQPGMPQPPSTAPLEERVAASRYAREAAAATQNYGIPNQNHMGNYNDLAREKPQDNTATAATSATRSRRKGPSGPEEAYRGASMNERQPGTNQHSRSTTVPSAPPAPLMRENSEILNRVVVSDPKEDAERIQERVAEAQPAPIGSDVTPATGLGLVGSEGVEDGGRGTQRRQEFSKSGSKRKDVQFGDYVLGQTLGEGEFGKVKLGWKRDGSTQVAIKLIRRETVATNPSRLPKIYREISILRDLAHPNIVRLHEMVETERYIGIILEYASGGELFDYILNNRYLKDPAARRLFAQLVSGVGYLHKKGIVHRDLKLENLLLDQNKNIIITDFGFANTFNPIDELSDEVEYNLGNKDFVRKYRLDRQDERGMRKGDLMQTSCGSPCYAAPELVVSDSLYTGRKVDVWSCGVILYAMLAGYLPFDDDPANPDGDNINLLYKYITTTPLTFPEYVSPHARDLLRRILVPDPRKRADLFEVARHSWLSEYHHVVSHITSSTTNIADIANTTVPSEAHDSPVLNRSASVREPSKSSGITPKSVPQQGKQAIGEEFDPTSTITSKGTRHTLQPEYVEPRSHTTRGPAPAPIEATSGATRQRGDSQGKILASDAKPLPQVPSMSSPSPEDFAAAEQLQQRMLPPVRPVRDVPRSVSDSTGAFGVPTTQTQTTTHQVTRPSTGGSLTSASGPVGTRSDLRLPSRGSYGQPIPPTVAATNAQGRVTQPGKSTRGYNISGPIPQHSAQTSIGQPMTQPMGSITTDSAGTPPPQAGKGHHRRTSTLSGLGQRLFGKGDSAMKKTRDSDLNRQKNGKKYPPTAMKESYATDGPRPSMESKRSFSLGFGRKRSSDLESQSEKPRRFSLIPSMSFKGLMGVGSRDQLADRGSPQTPQTTDFPQPPTGRVQSRPDTGSAAPPNMQYAPNVATIGNDGQQEQPRPKVNNFSRPPQSQQQYQQQYQQAAPRPSNDIYGGTGVYVPPSQYQDRNYQQQQQSFRPQYPDGFGDQSRPSMQQSRPAKGVLQKPHRRFDGYSDDHQSSSSGAVRKVQDFFRRRGRARADGDFR